ncbi:hypothetical protein SAMN05421542_0181 [Chryseobacterium jejuense]|uniref:Uncharacterized protein n=1 Tax=Chryseobacterium jejuense TaxID=445960 RepID=A0A2X2X6Y2_CHRJE|nr:hypothetical protein SAMN05421542_0181 [Chryseobacterium jejuense]SQB46451.1 Uncharacterised protein [Chryseobacterium jejuense]
MDEQWQSCVSVKNIGVFNSFKFEFVTSEEICYDFKQNKYFYLALIERLERLMANC